MTPESINSASSEEGYSLRGGRAKRRARKRHENDSFAAENPGFPSFASMQPMLIFLCFPTFLAAAIVVTGGGWSPIVLYPIALVLGIWVAVSTFYTMELILVCMVFYFPFAHEYPITIAPGLNATNALMLMGLFATWMRIYSRRDGWPQMVPSTILVLTFAFYTALSAVTILQQPGGWVYIRYSELMNYKGWMDQYVVFFIFINGLRDREAAKRLVVFLCISSMAVVLYTVPEMLDKSGNSTIEKSRIAGPLNQSNNMGGFVAYTLLPVAALFMVYMGRLRAWLVAPYFLIALKVLITTFSRGAYLAMAAGSLMGAWYRGKAFLLVWLSIGLLLIALFPQMLPESILARMETVTSQGRSTASTEELDASSRHRLVMWKAAGEMIRESPILGKGFKGFQKLKSDYTEIDLPGLSDPHNMYLYIGSQMGLPALLMFIAIILTMFWFGFKLSRRRDDQFVRAVGIGGAAIAVAYAVVGMFGSRMVSLEFTAHFWAYFVVLQVLYANRLETAPVVSRTRRSAVSLASANDVAALEAADSDNGPEYTKQLRSSKGKRGLATLPRRGRRDAATKESKTPQLNSDDSDDSSHPDSQTGAARTGRRLTRAATRRQKGSTKNSRTNAFEEARKRQP